MAPSVPAVIMVSMDRNKCMLGELGSKAMVSDDGWERSQENKSSNLERISEVKTEVPQRLLMQDIY